MSYAASESARGREIETDSDRDRETEIDMFCIIHVNKYMKMVVIYT